MKRKLDPFKLGLFVLSGAVIVIGGLLWIGAAHIFERTETYVTYFDKSVGGLNTGSKVKHLGIEIGRVSSIALAKEDKLVRVEMKIKPDFKVKKGEAAELQMAGITGGNYIAITKAPADLEAVTPKIDFPTRHPLIPSAPGKFETLESSVEGLGSQSTQVLARVEQTLSQLAQVLADLDALVQSMREEPGRILKQPKGREPFKK